MMPMVHFTTGYSGRSVMDQSNTPDDIADYWAEIHFNTMIRNVFANGWVRVAGVH